MTGSNQVDLRCAVKKAFPDFCRKRPLRLVCLL